MLDDKDKNQENEDEIIEDLAIPTLIELQEINIEDNLVQFQDELGAQEEDSNSKSTSNELYDDEYVQSSVVRPTCLPGSVWEMFSLTIDVIE